MRRAWPFYIEKYKKKRGKSMKENQIKAFAIAVFTPIFSGIGILAIPVLLLIVANMIDYGTGLVASKYRGQNINSYKSFRGIAKKVCMWLLVCVGVLVDMFIISYGNRLGITLPSAYIVGCLVAAWLFVNEIISILENVKDIGVNIPPFLLPYVKNIKSQVEGNAEESLQVKKESE